MLRRFGRLMFDPEYIMDVGTYATPGAGGIVAWVSRGAGHRLELRQEEWDAFCAWVDAQADGPALTAGEVERVDDARAQLRRFGSVWLRLDEVAFIRPPKKDEGGVATLILQGQSLLGAYTYTQPLDEPSYKALCCAFPDANGGGLFEEPDTPIDDPFPFTDVSDDDPDSVG
jgi:hypothetical protein